MTQTEFLSTIPSQILGHTCLGPSLSFHRRVFPLAYVILLPLPRRTQRLQKFTGNTLKSLENGQGHVQKRAQPQARSLLLERFMNLKHGQVSHLF